MKVIFVIIMLFIITPQLFSQSGSKNWREKMFVVCSGEMEATEIQRRAGINTSYKATFDIVNYQPVNIKIECADTLGWLDAYEKTTISNIKKLNFLEDSLGYSLIINYRYSPYYFPDNADYSGMDTLTLNFKSAVTVSIDPSICFEVDENKKTVTVCDYIYSEKRIKKKEDILVERQYYADSDTSIIIRNNAPYFTKQILNKADKWWKMMFERKLKDAGYEGFEPKKYYIKFRIINNPSRCVSYWR